MSRYAAPAPSRASDSLPSMNSSGLFRTADGRSHLATFLLVCTLFLTWGFCNGLLDVLNKHFQDTLHLSKAQSGLVQSAFYIGYFCMSLPAGLLAQRFGYRAGILAGLGIVAAGAFWFLPAVRIDAYWAFLLGLFVVASGLTCLETAANPYATVLGAPGAGAARINMAQSCNSVGLLLGPLVGGHFLMGGIAQGDRALAVPYVGLGILVSALFAIFAFAPVPEIRAEDDYHVDAEARPARALGHHPHFVLGVGAQFLNVAAQSGIFGFFINYVLSE
ncbi:MAG TPA: MFS transporter, partial [Candidatus Methylacidiphilales bacterium]